MQSLRSGQQLADGRLERLRHEREQIRAELMSLEALQKAALGEKNPQAARWLSGVPGAAEAPRLAQMLEVGAGWERAVETVLGDYLEAVRVDSLESLESSLGALDGGSVGFFEGAGVPGAPGSAGESTLAAHVRGPDAVLALLGGVRTSDSLAAALRARRALAVGESLITAAGEWIGRDWLRVNRGGEAHAGVLEREHRAQGAARALQRRRSAACARWSRKSPRCVWRSAPPSSSAMPRRARIQSAHREHADLLGRLEALRARVERGRHAPQPDRGRAGRGRRRVRPHRR